MSASIGELSITNTGVLMLSGILDYDSCPALRVQGKKLIQSCVQAQLVVDCSNVSKSNSVGLSLLLAFIRDAEKENKVLSLRSLPRVLVQMANVSGLLDWLSIENSNIDISQSN